MVQLVAFRRSFVALALCTAAIVVSATPASARLRHGAGRHAQARHIGHRHYRHVARMSRWDAGIARMHARGLAGVNASLASGAAAFSSEVAAGSRQENASNREPGAGFRFNRNEESSGGMAASGGFGSSSVVAEARRYIGGNPTGRGSLWCARFMNLVLQHSGYRGTGSDMARSFASYGQRVSGPQIGAIAVMGRRGGGHVGVVSGIDPSGNPIVVSGNNGNRVREAPISRGRIYAYVMPTG